MKQTYKTFISTLTFIFSITFINTNFANKFHFRKLFNFSPDYISTFCDKDTLKSYKPSTLAPINFVATNNDRVESNPVKVYDKRFGGNSYDSLNDLILGESESNCYLIGNTASNYLTSGGDMSEEGRGMQDYWVVKIDAWGNKIWDRRFGTTNDDLLYKGIRLRKNSLLLVGHTSGSGGDKTQNTYFSPFGIRDDGWVVKIDSLGNKIWDKQFGGNIDDYLYEGIKINDNEFILAGQTNSDLSNDVSQESRGGNDYWIIKIDSLGNKIWDRRYGGSNSDYFKKIVKTSDGGFILAGFSYSGLSGDKSQPSIVNGGVDLWIIKVNSNGDKEWDKTLGTVSMDILNDLKITDDSNILICSNVNNSTSYIYKLDLSGNLIWQKTYLNSSNFNNLLPNSKGIIVVGTATTTTGIISPPSKGGYSDGFILQLDSLGNKVWDKRFGGNDSDNIVEIVPIYRGYLIAGTSSSSISEDKTQNNRGFFDYWILRLNNNEAIEQPVTVPQNSSINLIANNCGGTITWIEGVTAEGAIVTIYPDETKIYSATCTYNNESITSSIQVTVNSCSQVISLTQNDNIVTGTTNAPIVIKAQDTINAINTIGNPPANAVAEYKAGKSIMLNAGFKVEVGSVFKANISNTPCN